MPVLRAKRPTQPAVSHYSSTTTPQHNLCEQTQWPLRHDLALSDPSIRVHSNSHFSSDSLRASITMNVWVLQGFNGAEEWWFACQAGRGFEPTTTSSAQRERENLKKICSQSSPPAEIERELRICLCAAIHRRLPSASCILLTPPNTTLSVKAFISPLLQHPQHRINDMRHHHRLTCTSFLQLQGSTGTDIAREPTYYRNHGANARS